MTFQKARRTLKTALKMALPYGLVRAVQTSRERDQLIAELDRLTGHMSDLERSVVTLEADRQERNETRRQQQVMAEVAAAEEAARLVIERETFSRNEIVVDGKRIRSRAEAPLIDLQIDGYGHTIRIDHPTGPGTLHVITQPGTSGCRLEFGAKNQIFTNVFVSFFQSGGNFARQSAVQIGKDNLFNGNVHILAGVCPSTLVEIGDQNLFADNIQIRAAVEHLTYNVETMARESVEHGIRIHNRVWLCNEAMIYNRSEIASDNVVAARTLTNRPFTESNTVIAGVPAKVKKRGVMWHLNTTDDYLTAVGPLRSADF
ncbi:hypothetical protein [Variovorax atrisoli]|uniref:hypothetical protein n=1 Tax=Variovorax atrisoli TaxID=3394203 RepID=UPI0033972EF0